MKGSSSSGSKSPFYSVIYYHFCAHDGTYPEDIVFHIYSFMFLTLYCELLEVCPCG